MKRRKQKLVKEKDKNLWLLSLLYICVLFCNASRETLFLMFEFLNILNSNVYYIACNYTNLHKA